MQIKYQGTNIFEFPVNIPPTVKFDTEELKGRLVVLMDEYGLTRLEVSR